MKIYFAGPLFSVAEKEFNLRLTEKLETLEFDVFLPQRDGIESEMPPYNEMSREERRKLLFETDRDQIFESDIFLFVLDGRVPDEGACVELGMAYTYRNINESEKLIVGLQSDVRAAFMASKLNPMLRMAFDKIVDDENALLEILISYKSSKGTAG